MSAKQFPGSPAPEPVSTPRNHVSLGPLLDHAQAALAPDPASDILNMALTEIVARWHNAFNETLIRRADDLLACAARTGPSYDPIPKGAELLGATLNVRFAESLEPHTVSIAPPHTVTFHNPADAARLVPLLTRRGFLGHAENTEN